MTVGRRRDTNDVKKGRPPLPAPCSPGKGGVRGRHACLPYTE